jgi:hypothetical protein
MQNILNSYSTLIFINPPGLLFINIYRQTKKIFDQAKK